MVSFLRFASLPLVGVCIPFALAAQLKVLTSNYGTDRTNANLRETLLTPANVNADRFGKVGSFPVDANIYAQPLYVPGVIIAGVARNVVYAATMNNTIYAIDADAPAETRPIWKVNLGPPVPPEVNDSDDTAPATGILSTPVIDVERNAIYVVAEKHVKGTAAFYLHSIDLSNGTDKPGSPVEIKAIIDGGGETSVNGKIAFDAVMHLQRPGLLLANDKIYIAFGSHADNWPYH